jgi:hypothetical protein
MTKIHIQIHIPIPEGETAAGDLGAAAAAARMAWMTAALMQ